MRSHLLCAAFVFVFGGIVLALPYADPPGPNNRSPTVPNGGYTGTYHTLIQANGTILYIFVLDSLQEGLPAGTKLVFGEAQLGEAQERGWERSAGHPGRIEVYGNSVSRTSTSTDPQVDGDG